MEINNLTIGNATHYLKCRHAINSNYIRSYVMNCILLKRMKKNRVKILLFGERDWAGMDDKKSIRYVNEYKIFRKK